VPSSPGLRAAPNGQQTPETAGSDFVVLTAPARTTVGMVFAKDGDGKTFFCVNYCPQPVVVIGLDGRGEPPILNAIRSGRKVFYLDASTPFNVMEMEHEQAQAAAQESLHLITRNYEWAVEKSIKEWGKGTLVIDTTSEFRDIARTAVRGRVDRPNPRTGERGDFGKSDALINRTMKYVMDRARQSNLNLILLARSKPVYEGREDTGRITFDTDKVFTQGVDWIVEYRKVVGMGMLGGLSGPMVGGGLVGNVGGPVAPSTISYEIAVTSPKLVHAETGAVYRQTEWEAAGVGPFAYLCEKVVPGSTVEDWK
jgi:hypothetical protein